MSLLDLIWVVFLGDLIVGAASPESDTPDTGRRRVLFVLKTKGPMTAPRLARRLGITAMAVHQHLSSLREEGLVDFTKERRKVGRPAHLWELTSEAHEHFPDCHADLVVGMLQAIKTAFGDEGLQQLAEERTRQQVKAYRKRMPEPSAPIEKRVKALAQIRRAEGFMAEWGRVCDGSIEFVEHHCSIAKAARFCPGLCDGELEVFRAVLGETVSVDRLEHALRGDPRCAYHIVDHAADTPWPATEPSATGS